MKKSKSLSNRLKNIQIQIGLLPSEFFEIRRCRIEGGDKFYDIIEFLRELKPDSLFLEYVMVRSGSLLITDKKYFELCFGVDKFRKYINYILDELDYLVKE